MRDAIRIAINLIDSARAAYRRGDMPAMQTEMLAARKALTDALGISVETNPSTPQIDRRAMLRDEEANELVLLWSTPRKRITQAFGMRPKAYEQWGLPAHDGTDQEAHNGDPITAAATGVVKLVASIWRRGQGGRKTDHPYGYHVRLVHVRKNGIYETIYCHLQDRSARFKEGDIVLAGEMIGKADSTGNVTGAHHHFTLKKLGATARSEQQTIVGGIRVVYPFDIVNPEPFGVDWPAHG